jgi:hypothetical protein
MSMLAEIARRAVSHPHTATFVKRAVAVQNGEGEKLEIPTWGVVVLYLSFVLASVFITLVRTFLQPGTTTPRLSTMSKTKAC